MKAVKVGVLAFLYVVLFLSSKGQPLDRETASSSVFDTLINRLHTELTASGRSPALARQAARNLETMRGDGSWQDIDYSNHEITMWTPERHLKRLQDMAIAYADNGDPALYQGIVNGLQYWYKKDPRSGNWWHNEIRTPQTLGQILITLRFASKPLPVDLEDSLIHRMKRGDIVRMTGANKLDVAIHFLYRAALTKDMSLMDTAVREAFQPIGFTTGEGLQIDYSYLQHGPQLQLSSYGAVFLDGEYKVAKYLLGTRYALKDSALNLLSTYYKNSYLRAIRGSYMDFSVEGRAISRPGILHKEQETNRLGEAQLVDPSNGMAWYAAIARTSGAKPAGYAIQPAHTHFWRADYTMHTRPGYAFNVRTVSDRTRRTESGNKENLYGRYLPDGATDIQVRGDEYYNIMPVWEWDKIPGVTSAMRASDKLMDKFWGEAGSTSFAGGVSDSLYGASTYVMNYDGVTASKSWFFFDREIVCVGAGIRGGGVEAIGTTVNQCWLRGKVTVYPSDGKPVTASDGGAYNYSNPQWIVHDGIGYYFPAGGQVALSTRVQKGDWYHINNGYSKEEVSGKVFKLWLDHGVQPAGARYAYVVVPGLTDVRGYAAADIHILANSDSIQAVRQQGLDVLQAVFFKVGSVADSGSSVSVDAPCVVMVKHWGRGALAVSVADPTQRLARVKITIRRADGVYTKVVELPQGIYAGSTVSFAMEPATGSSDVPASGVGPASSAGDFVSGNFSFAATQLKGMLSAVNIGDSLFPRSTDTAGRLFATGMHDWTGGFFPGALWYAYEYTHDTSLRTAAAAWTEKLAPMQFFTGHHDLGFVLNTSYGNGYRLTGDTSYAAVMVQAARSLCTRFNPKVGCIKSWNSFTSWHGGVPFRFPVIIDNMMNLELLFSASRITGDPRYRQIAIAHAETTLKNQVRSDYSCYHVVCYDSASGAVLGRETAQGYADNSAWSRGQAWAIYGFTVVYRETRDPRYLEVARKMADFFLQNPHLPDDKIPYWDFDVNQKGFVPGEHSRAKAGGELLYRDASAAAITASALFELSTYMGAGGKYYFDNAVAILHSLAGPAYRAAPGMNDHFLLKHSVGSIPHGFEVDSPIIYADYYFLEALHRYAELSR